MPDKLYAAPPSLYSGKARSYMDWKAIDYREVLSSPKIFEDVIVPAIGYPVIPVIETDDGRLIQDTTLIIDHYEASAAGPSVYPATPLQKLIALLFELYGDEWLLIPAMHYRWHYNEEWIYTEFGKSIAPDADDEQQYRLGKARGQMFKGFVPILGINAASIPAIEASYEALLAELNAHFDQFDYLLGSRPSIGDYGLIGPLYAHLYRDPQSGKIIDRLAPNVARWIERMVDVQAPLSGEFLGNDQIPESLYPIIRRMMAEMMPWLQNIANILAEKSEQLAHGPLPRSIGEAGFEIDGVASQRIASPYSLWMLQRPLDHYHSLMGEAMDAANNLLQKICGHDFAEFHLPIRVRFDDHKIYIAQG